MRYKKQQERWSLDSGRTIIVHHNAAFAQIKRTSPIGLHIGT